MGNKHPISLRLKNKLTWGNTSYYFNSRNYLSDYWGIDKIAVNIIKHYFQYAILSKIKISKDSNKVVISFYYFLNLPVSKRFGSEQSKNFFSFLQEGNISNNKKKFNVEAKGYSNLILKLSRFYGKPVELRPIRIHYPYLNSYILAQYIALNIKKANYTKILRTLFKKVILVKNNNITAPTNVISKDLIKYNSARILPLYPVGIKVVISGRLSQRKAASRTSIIRKSIGTLKLSSNSSIIDASKFSFVGKNGSITVKIWISSINTIRKN